jgi:hypothetical protein
MNSAKTPTVGGHIDAQCTRCRMLTNHTVVAMVAARPVKVQCNTCGGTHGYRAPKAKTNRTSATPRRVSDKPKEKGLSADQEQWSKAMQERASIEERPYSMDASFIVAEWIRHPQFGLGQVLATFKPNKMEVLFEQGRKMLRCRLG